MYRYFIELAFDGTRYHGWQIQKNADSVQARLNHALSTLFRKPIETVGCGRTDTGVHAKQLFAHFDIAYECNNEHLQRINALLPHDITAKQLLLVANHAHARFDANTRSYEYHIHFLKNPFLHQKSWWFRHGTCLDVDAMNQAAMLLQQCTDFSCFSKSNTQTHTNNCHIHQAHFTTTTEGLLFTITADRFLRNMVRAIVGTLIEVGKNKI